MKQGQGNSHALQRWLRAVGIPAAFGEVGDLLGRATQASSGMFIVDADKNVVHWDEGMESLLGFTAQEMLGNSCLTGNRCITCMRGCGLAKHGAATRVKLTLHHKSGIEVELLKTGKAFFDGSGNFLGTIELMSVPEPDSAGGARPTPPDPTGTPIPSEGMVEFHGMRSADSQMREMFRTIRNTAETEAAVLARGESGTGKELLARAIHKESPRRDGPLVAVNCAALSPSLLESQLFGHVKGAFTGATSDRKGIFEAADGGTIFLDEIAELPLDLQAKLLRVIEEREVCPVGCTKPKSFDVRVVAATHRSLREAVDLGNFRADLMYRLRVVPLFIPALRDRRSDIPLLLQMFIDRHNQRGLRKVRTIHPDAMKQLLDHSWPGNVRELLNVVQYAFAVGRGPQLLIEELPPELRLVDPTAKLLHTGKAASEVAAIQDALKATDGQVTAAAIRLGMSRATFWRKRRKYGL
jgi:transcriptional regulator with PAS, ATPase and Fis domain